MAQSTPFGPLTNATITIAVTSTNSNTTLPTTGNAITVLNIGPNVAFVNLASSGTTTTTTGMPININERVILSRNDAGGNDYISAICAATQTATLYVTAGYGSSI